MKSYAKLSVEITRTNTLTGQNHTREYVLNGKQILLGLLILGAVVWNIAQLVN